MVKIIIISLQHRPYNYCPKVISTRQSHTLPNLIMSSPLYIGLDNSTQALKAVVIDQHLNTLYEHRLDFADDLPEYKTKSGVIIADDGSVLAPVLMYVEAMEKVFDNLKSQ